jgi:hypothetical protein
MATVSYTVDQNLATGDVIVEWNGMSVGDDGEPFECRGLVARAWHMFGNFSEANLHIDGSFQSTPSEFGSLYSYSTPLANGRSIPWIASSIRPRIGSGDGSTDLGLVMIFRSATEYNAA